MNHCYRLGYSYDHCANSSNGCCAGCDKLATCSDSCPRLANEKAKLRTAQKADRRAEKAAEEARELPKRDMSRTVWGRVGMARASAGLDIQAVVEASGRSWYRWQDQEFAENESLTRDVSKTTPFGYSVGAEDLLHLVRVADVLRVSLDWLLGRADNPTPDPGIVWHDGDEELPPTELGRRTVATWGSIGLSCKTADDFGGWHRHWPAKYRYWAVVDGPGEGDDHADEQSDNAVDDVDP